MNAPVPHRIALGFALTLLALTLGGCKPEEAQAPPPVRPVLYTVVEPKVSKLFGPFAGTIEPRYQAQLGFQIAGRMVARDVSVGDLLAAGKRLAALDPTVTQFALTQARADVADAKAQLANASATAERQKILFGNGAVTQAQLENATAARDTAAARLTQAEAGLQKAQDQMGYTELHADFAGVVTAWNAEVGQVVSSGQAVVTLARPDVKEAVVDIPDALMGEVQPGEAFAVTLQAASDVTTTGRVREIAPQADAATRTRRVRLSLSNPPNAFRLGTTVTVSVVRPIPPCIDLPATALLERDGLLSVWVVAKDGKSVVSRKVDIVARNANSITIGAGLAKGDKVVVAGVHSLAEAEPVRLGTAL